MYKCNGVYLDYNGIVYRFMSVDKTFSILKVYWLFFFFCMKCEVYYVMCVVINFYFILIRYKK